MPEYSYKHYKTHVHNIERLKPRCYVTLKNRYLDECIYENIIFTIDTGAMVTRFNRTLSHNLFSRNINDPPDYITEESECIVETGNGKAKRYLQKIDEIIFLDLNGKPLLALEDIDVHLVPYDSNEKTNLLGMNAIEKLKKIKIDSEKTTIFWQ